MSTIQKVQVDDNGTELAYIDSGKPSGDTYTTLVCVHGHSYHAQNFSRLLALAKKHNLRIIALNRRDYTGSTPFSQAELQVLKDGTDSEKHEFMRARGLEIAKFLVWVIKELKIPRASEDGTAGGLALLGWSLGNITTIAFLGNLSSFPEDIVQTLEPYLRTFIMYELPDNCFGYPRPEGYYHPFEDASIPERIRGISFGKWVSSYYEHPAYKVESSSVEPSTTTTTTTTTNTGSVFPPGNRTLDALQLRAPKKSARPCTLDKFTPNEILTCVDIAPGPRSEWPLWHLPSSLLQEQKRRAFLAGSEQIASDSEAGGNEKLRLPKLKIHVICGLASLWVVQWETWNLEEEYLKWASEGKERRPVKFVPVEGANHFLHWDDSEQFLKLCSDGIKS
ncbi:uncharacterized protein FOMMEDRAFT_111212 [Fomitiporia mediterranea MF3/22]|uniref:uncharacterized protein n=1 Tax=Fomitiporia mediterranea (strain MF3/22) TaxID=694068 RepID=UPI00044095FA|nr:uncharacterized protein FOMMEDRAFT_111212 [Fomitiporia mediterranea MF3/22]EJD01416.1 hypothetical protein FOMMEDRAFT_111212 [Fomitiporia mediterranea MF3/22]